MSKEVASIVWFSVLCFTITSAFLPTDISNYQNEYICDTSIDLVRPLTVADVQEAVRRYNKVKAVGAGHSWNNIFCSVPSTVEDGVYSANIAMTTIQPQEINVNEEDSSAWVSAGVIVWHLMDYLGDYTTASAPNGYALGATPFFVNQTIAGAIATGTHGSSLTHSSLSNQVNGFRVVLANGTLAEFTPDSHPFLFRAFRVNVGRLGVVTEVKLRIFPEKLVKRTLRIGVPENEILPRFKAAQETYKTTGVLPSWLDGTMILWNPTDDTIITFTLEDEEDSEILRSSEDSDFPLKRRRLFAEKVSERNDRMADGVLWETPEPMAVIDFYKEIYGTGVVVSTLIKNLVAYLNNATLETHDASVSEPLPVVDMTQTTLVDDYEIAIPADKMADCFEAAIDFLKNEAPDNGLRNIMGLRLVNKEDGLLSVGHDKPHAWLEMQDFVYYNQVPRATNEPFKKFIAFMLTTPSCSPVRLHWGKAGWPDKGCWNGAKMFKETWCGFGCAVRALDPQDKFSGLNASVEGGIGMGRIWNYVVQRMEDCPEPPYYTNR